MGAVLLVAVNGIDPGDPPSAMAGVSAVLTVTVGAILVSRVPWNSVGWLLWLGGLSLSVTLGTGGLATYGLVTRPGAIPGAIWLAWVSAWTGPIPIYLLAGFLPLVFPTGGLLTSRWRLAVAIGVVALVADVVALMLGPTSHPAFPDGVANPLVVGGAIGTLLASAGSAAQPAGVVLIVAGGLAVVLRFRRSAGAERQQVKWFTSTAALVVMALAAAATLESVAAAPDWLVSLAWFATMAGLSALPVTIAIAVLRYRLYDIDRIISRTITYAASIAVLAVIFTGTVLVLEALLAPVTRGQAIAVAGSTLVVVALFTPLLRRVRLLVDRRFDRSRYDGRRTAAAFGERLRDEVDLAAVTDALSETVAGALAPTSLGIWIRPRT